MNSKTLNYKISVIMPVYNGANTLAETLDSLLDQTCQDFELIACIDGSKDDSLKILQSYQNKFKSLHILENPQNMGLGRTMNRLVFHAQGDYIAVAEQDDFYYPHRLELQKKVLDSQYEVGLVSGIAEFWDGEHVTFKFPGLLVDGKSYPKGKEMFLMNYRDQLKVVNSCMMFRKALHVNNGLYFSMHYPNIPIDWAYVLRFSLISEIQGIPKELVRLDRSHDRTSITTYKYIRFKAARELIRSFAYEYPHIITKEDHRYALCTQFIIEINQHLGLTFIMYSLFYILRYPLEHRFKANLFKRIKKKFRL